MGYRRSFHGRLEREKVGEYYYLFVAEGGTAGPPTSHMVVQARSKNIMGPWENAPFNPLLRTESRNEKWWSKGHGSIVDTEDGRLFMISMLMKTDSRHWGVRPFYVNWSKKKMDGYI